jgi:hypothetical protein
MSLVVFEFGCSLLNGLRDLADAPLVKEVNSRYHRLGYAFNGGAPHRCIVESESKHIAHAGPYPASRQDASVSTLNRASHEAPALVPRERHTELRCSLLNFLTCMMSAQNISVTK